MKSTISPEKFTRNKPDKMCKIFMKKYKTYGKHQRRPV